MVGLRHPSNWRKSSTLARGSCCLVLMMVVVIMLLRHSAGMIQRWKKVQAHLYYFSLGCANFAGYVRVKIIGFQALALYHHSRVKFGKINI